METASESAVADFLPSFAHQRRQLLTRAGAILVGSPREKPADEAVRQLSQMLLTALEVLKIAEAEIVDDRQRAHQRAMQLEQELAHARDLFRCAPTPLLTTRLDGFICECNDAASALFRRTADQLQGRRIMELVPRDRQPAFRDQFAQVKQMGEVAAWSFPLDRRGDLSIVVRASVKSAQAGPRGEIGFHWNLQPLESISP